MIEKRLRNVITSGFVEKIITFIPLADENNLYRYPCEFSEQDKTNL